jgi:hypothetical protein
MFSLAQIDARITVLRTAAEDLYAKADTYTHVGTQISLRCYADGLTVAADMLQKMIGDEVEREAREAMTR